MTDRLTIPGDLLPLLGDGPTVLAVGEMRREARYECPQCEALPRLPEFCPHDRRVAVPPSGWPVTDRKCETCGGPYVGEGVVQVPTGEVIAGAPVYRFADCPNPACVKGVLAVEVVVECEWCGGEGWLLGDPDHYERGTEAVIDCVGDDGECCDDGLVSAGLWVLTVAPVVLAQDEPPLDREQVIVLAGNVYHWAKHAPSGGWAGDVLTPAHRDALAATAGPPDTWPGKVALIGRRVEP